MKILLTGATGFLGSNLLEYLVNAGHDTTILVRNTSSFNRIDHLINHVSIHRVGDDTLFNVLHDSQIETIIHCATNYGRGYDDPVEILEANLILPLQLLQNGYNTGVRCFINTDTLLDKRVSDYALSKNQFLQWLRNYAQKLVCINVALEHFYGPLDNSTKFVSYIVKQLLDGVENIDLTLGEQKRDFIFIDDIVSAFMLIINHCTSVETGYMSYEIGTGATISIREFVEVTKQITGNTTTKLNFGAVAYRENEAMHISVDRSAIQALGWQPCYSVQAGLTKMIAIERKARAL